MAIEAAPREEPAMVAEVIEQPAEAKQLQEAEERTQLAAHRRQELIELMEA